MQPKYLALLLLFTSSASFAQQTHLQGSIIAMQTGKPIAGATISILAKNFFYPADDEGRFDIPDFRFQGTDTVMISCVGYQSRKIMVDSLRAHAVIQLNTAITALNEVTVRNKAQQSIKVGSKVKSNIGSASFLPGMGGALFMIGSENLGGVIQSAGFYVRNGAILSKYKGDYSAPFRIRIYEAKADTTPGRELTTDVIIVSAKQKNAWFDVDISTYRITNPPNGFFVSFVLLDKGYYLINEAYKNGAGIIYSSEEILAPHLGFTQHEFKRNLSFTETTHNNIIFWHKTSQSNYMIRATVSPE